MQVRRILSDGVASGLMVSWVTLEREGGGKDAIVRPARDLCGARATGLAVGGVKAQVSSKK